MNISDKDFIAVNLPKISEQNIIAILLNFKIDLDKYNARLEKPNIGTYLYLNKIPGNILKKIRKDIEIYM